MTEEVATTQKTRKVTFYIVPAWSDQAGQCRIVGAEGEIQSARDSYRAHGKLWQEVGIMNSRGGLVCLNGGSVAWKTLKDAEPLSAGLQFVLDIDEQAKLR